MTYTRTFTDQTPPKRYDGVSFKSATITECATIAGVYADLEAFSLVPYDGDPSTPQSRNFTTDLATLAGGGFYVFRWSDEAGSTADSIPVAIGSAAVTANLATLRQRAGVSATEYTLDGTTYWTDGQLTAVLTANMDANLVVDMDGAVADVLEAWSAQLSRAYDVTMDGQSLKRSQMSATLAARAERYRDATGGGDLIQTVEVKATT